MVDTLIQRGASPMTPLKASVSILREVYAVGESNCYVMTEGKRKRITHKLEQAANPGLRLAVVEFFQQVFGFDLEKPMKPGAKVVWRDS